MSNVVKLPSYYQLPRDFCEQLDRAATKYYELAREVLDDAIAHLRARYVPEICIQGAVVAIGDEMFGDDDEEAES